MPKFSNHVQPGYDQFVEMLEESSVVPLRVKFSFDMATPLALLDAFPPESFVCLLESLGDPGEASRYTILGLDPKATFSFDGEVVRETWAGEEPKISNAKGVIRKLDDFLRSFHSVYSDTMPLSNGGLIGYVSRDLAIESRSVRRSELPLVHFIVPQTFIVFDAKERHLTLLVNAFAHDGDDHLTAFNKVTNLLESHKARVQGFIPPCYVPLYSDIVPSRTTDEADSGFTDMAAKLTGEAVRCGISKLYLSRELRHTTKASPIDVYRVFRTVYPSEYTYLFKMNDAHYIGSHEFAEAPHSLSFANLLRHVLGSSRFGGQPSERAIVFREEHCISHRHSTAAFGYVGFNGTYKLSHGNKELVLVRQGDSTNEAIFSQAAHAHWEGLYSSLGPTMKMSSAESIASCICQILIAAESFSKLESTPPY